MKKKILSFLQKGTVSRLLICGVLTVLLFTVYMCLVHFGLKNPLLVGFLMIALYLILLFVIDWALRFSESRLTGARKAEIAPILQNITLDLIVNMHLPILINDEKGRIIWCNRAFSSCCGQKNPLYGEQVEELTGVGSETLNQTSDAGDGVFVSAMNATYHVKSYPVESHSKKYFLSIWNDKTDLLEASRKLEEENTLIAYIMIDNLEELERFVQDKTTEAVADIYALLRDWAASVNGVLKEYEREKFIMLYHAHDLESFTENRFDILDKIREVRIGEGNLPLTVSIGTASVGDTLAEKEHAASAALDMALERGGDQVVVKTERGMEFFGGRTKTMQKRTKVRSRVVANRLTALMEQCDNVIVMGHKRIDFDAIGACIGIVRIALHKGVRVNMVVNRKDQNFLRCYERLASIPEYNMENNPHPIFVDPQDAPDLLTPGTLLIILDVNARNQMELPELSDIALKTVFIDHHRKSAEFTRQPVLSYIEASASSTCELVSEILEETLPDSAIQQEEANLLYAGILLDTQQFVRNTGVRTFGAVLYLRGVGANPAEAQALFRTDLVDFISEARFESNVSLYRGCMAISVCEISDPSDGDRIAAAKAADKLLTVDSVLASFAVCRIGNVVHISARSSGTVNVQLILEKLSGGGHFDSAATQLTDVGLDRALALLKNAIDEYLNEQ